MNAILALAFALATLFAGATLNGAGTQPAAHATTLAAAGDDITCKLGCWG
jgi:hypothetical protein